VTAPPPDASRNSLSELLGGRSAALDATLPPVAFVAGYVAADESIGWGAAASLVVAGGVGAWRLTRGARPRAALVGVLFVAIAAMIALRTGRAADFFLLRIVANTASALAFATSIVLRWPLLGVVVGLVLGQKGRWRRDPALLRAYSRASWVWAIQYALRVAVLVPLWAANEVVALGVAQVALTWPLVAAALAASWWVIRRSLPPEHPGLRHPVTEPGETPTMV
jgi:hypothetical protein